MPLLVIATPIGNLGDMSRRAKEALTSASVVLCEDTRKTRALLSASDIDSPSLISCNAHNEEGRIPQVMERLRAEESVVLVCDAGTPGISDPGGLVVAAAHRHGLPVRVIPGPSSVAAALSVSGFPLSPHHFLGFPPRKRGALRSFLVEASRLKGPFVCLESGKRLATLLSVLTELMPDREACICRELTKLHEQVIRGAVGELPIVDTRGEVVLVVGPGAPVEQPSVDVDGAGLKAAAAILAKRWNCSKRDAYQRLLAMEQD